MPEEEIEQREETEESPTPEKGVGGSVPVRPPRRYFTRRNVGISTAALAIILVLAALFTVVFYKYGVFDNYVKTQFTAKMADIGVVFDADVFRVTVNPLELELKNATFNDRVSGEKLFFIRDARLALSVQDLYSWQLSRDISVDTTDINGAEVWVNFDENGRSNFANLVFVQEEGARINFKYDSVRFAVHDAVIHFGDIVHKINADANNVHFFLEPENPEAPDDQKRYKISLTSTDSRFVYDGNPLEEIDIQASGIAAGNGAEITELRIETPIGVSAMSGTLTDWKSLKYNLNVESTVDLTQTSSIFPLGTSITGIGNFKGNVSGEGANYRVEGVIDSQSLTAEGIYLKGINVAATVEGTNSMYDANGTAIAELLTFEDFRIEFPKITGNVRGTGTDFRWVGELQAAAARTKSLTLGGLFLSDAVAEYKDKQLTAQAGNGRAQRFSVADTEFANLQARNLKISRANGVTSISAPTGSAASMKTKDYELSGITGRNLKVRDQGGRTDVELDGLRASSARLKDNRVRNVTADKFELTDLPNSTDIDLRNLRAEQIDGSGATIHDLSSPLVEIRDTPADTVIYADAARIAKIDAGGAVLGSLNIAGVRLTIRQGRVEGRTNDIDAGNIAIKANKTIPEGGTLEGVQIAKPVFVVEPSGRYRVTADMSIGGGIVGNIPLGPARAAVDVTNERAQITNIDASVMEGKVAGDAVIALNNRTRSNVNVNFSDLDLSKVVALQGGRVIPLEGRTTGSVDLTFSGTDLGTASGKINADIAASAGDAASGLVPVNGRVELTAASGLFTVDYAKLNTASSELSATGRFDVKNSDSNLDIALNSTDASEVDRLIRVLGVAPDLERQLDSMHVEFAGNLNFNGKLTGNATDPTIDGRASLASISLQGREVGSVTSDIFVSPLGLELRNGVLQEPAGGGNIAFSVNIPTGGANNTTVQATLSNVNAGNLLAALPITMPERLRDFTGQTSGTVNLTGLPNESQGEINLASTGGTVAGQAFDSLNVKAVFAGTLITLENAEIRLGQGLLTAKGTYDHASHVFNADAAGQNVPLPLALSFLPANVSMPTVAGLTDFTASLTGDTDDSATYNFNFSGNARDVVVNDNPFGPITFSGTTANQILTADLTATLEGRPQVVNATVNFGDADMPFRLTHTMDRSPLGPFFSLVPQLNGISVTGTGTGNVEFGGNLLKLEPDGTRVFTSEYLAGSARFSQLALQIQDTPLVATEPVVVRFSPNEITFDSARFSGGGSNMTIAGTVSIVPNGSNNLTVNGRVNLALLNAFPQIGATDTFFSGFADVAIRITGPARTLSGTAELQNASVAAFFGASRLTANRLNGRILFSSNQAQIDRMTGMLGGGEFVASGGALFGENLQVDRFRVELNGSNVTVPVPEDFITTGDARLVFSGDRVRGTLVTLLEGNILARRSIYSQDVELANIFGARGDGSLSGGASTGRATRLDLTIEGRDALIIRNNIADLTASASIRLTGNTNNPRVEGRITANSGTIFFRKDRYIVQRGVLEFPPNTEIEPIINLQAETEIGGYQIFINLSGPLTDTENLNATVRSSPALPQADVISLVTTGNLSNTESGIPTLATGLNTAAEVLTDSIINAPARRATDKLFGLNVFEIDPIISGQQLNPSARLTVGRQINNNLRITYATNLSQDQNQVVALEYRVSNKLSFVAQYEQRSLSNVTQDRDNFSFEVRFRRRF